MIRQFEKRDLDRVMELWLKTNISAHPFIRASYWHDAYDEVYEMMPLANLYVYEVDRTIAGFVGIQDGYIAGIFVEDQYQTKGIGRALLNHVKSIYESLELDVYEENIKAHKFYLNQDFKEISHKRDALTQVMEVHMKWSLVKPD